MIHNFKGAESWENKASNAYKLALASLHRPSLT